MKNPKKELHDLSDDYPTKIEETTKEKGLTQRQKIILGETKRRHDKALRRLAQM